MLALARRNIATPGRVRMQRTVRPRIVRLPLACSRPTARLVPRRRRRARIVRRLRRQIELRLKLRHPRRKRQNQVDQGFLVQRLKGLAIYPIRQSDPTALVKAADPNCLEPVTSEIRLEIGLNNYRRYCASQPYIVRRLIRMDRATTSGFRQPVRCAPRGCASLPASCDPACEHRLVSSPFRIRQICPVNKNVQLLMDRLIEGDGLYPWEAEVVRQAGAFADRIVLNSNPAVQACRRMGLPADYLYVHRNAVVGSAGPFQQVT